MKHSPGIAALPPFLPAELSYRPDRPGRFPHCEVRAPKVWQCENVELFRTQENAKRHLELSQSALCCGLLRLCPPQISKAAADKAAADARTAQLALQDERTKQEALREKLDKVRRLSSMNAQLPPCRNPRKIHLCFDRN